MGEYIPPPDKKPLTSLAYPSPGPADYTANADLTLDTAPIYSIIGRRRTKLETYDVGPADHDTAANLVWKRRPFAIKGKLPYKVVTSEGAKSSKYNVKYHNIGRYIPKCSMGLRPKGASGYPHNQDIGQDAPGPILGIDYKKHGPQYSFGTKQRVVYELTPGPADYTAESKREGPFYTVANKLKDTSQSDKKRFPAPNKYDIKTYMGQAPGMPINGIRRPPLKPTTTVPAPNDYTKPDTIKKHQKATMPYKPFPMKGDMTPAPNAYEDALHLSTGPEYSMKDKNPLTYPDTIWCPKPEGLPGPAGYMVDDKDIQTNINPKYSMAKVLPVKGQGANIPGPNVYDIPPSNPHVKPTPPSYSMGARCLVEDRSEMPSAAEYYPNIDDTGLKYSVGIRLKPTKRPKVPAPNAHRVETGQTRAGIYVGNEYTFKGRQSPYVYSGFQRHQ
ncbi:hypothetical protein LSAT2_020985 [Lamellibrachia satsuma]|nr:hypothetical protein LSAT2_020985 [Lamellibrachia satsuma]